MLALKEGIVFISSFIQVGDLNLVQGFSLPRPERRYYALHEASAPPTCKRIATYYMFISDAQIRLEAVLRDCRS